MPADAEIVIEGLIDPELLEPEGPFGESHGYVALEDFNMSMRVTAITHKRAPVFVSIVSQVTPSESSVIKRVAYEPMYLAHLRDTLSIKGIRGVVLHEPLSNIRPVIFLKFAPGTPQTEVWRGLNGAAMLKADSGKVVIAVSEDVDPRNADAVLWSIAYRANIGEDLHVVPYRSGGHGPKSGRRDDSTLLIDATLKHAMPPLALPARPYMERARVMWEELGLPALKPRPPWHGYGLGEWDAVWDRYAERAVEGRWADSGIETFARRRGGLTPETPVHDVEGEEAEARRPWRVCGAACVMRAAVGDRRRRLGTLRLSAVGRRARLAGLDEPLNLVHEAHIGFDLRKHAFVRGRRPALSVQARDQLALTEDQCFRMRNRRMMRGFGLRLRHARASKLGQSLFHNMPHPQGLIIADF